MQDKLLSFFHSYKQAFDAFDHKAISLHYMLPCATSDYDGALVFNDMVELQNKFLQNCQNMQNIGYSGSDLKIESIQLLGSKTASIDIKWSVILEKESYEFGGLYVCFYQQDRWKIFSASVYAVSQNI